MLRFSALLLLLSSVVSTVYGWGQKGHFTICYIAECHLSHSAMESVTELLDGYSMVYYANWADGAKYTKEYSYTRSWHYLSMERHDSMATVERNKDGDILSALEELEATLRDKSADFEARVLALKLYIHIMGDLHQPMHMGREVDDGGGLIPVVYFTESTSLHSAWDYHVLMGAREWSYTEWQQQIDRLSEAEEARVVEGSYSEWIDATHEITKEIYRDTPPETRIYYDYIEKYRPIVEQQLLYGGLRLANMLNDIYK